MKYMGSKRRIAKYILPIMLAERKPGQWWVEPFVGGGNMIDKVTGKRIGADANRYTIEALTAIRDHAEELPKNNKEFTEEDYKLLRKSDDYRFKGYAGFAFAFGATWLGSWSRNRKGRDYVKVSYNNAVKQSPALQGIKLVNKDYLSLEIPDNSLIYCDPPYAMTSKYATGKFDHNIFWQWCRDKAREGHTIFISEYNAPEDFICVWQREVTVCLNGKAANTKKPIEKLFRYGDKEDIAVYKTGRQLSLF